MEYFSTKASNYQLILPLNTEIIIPKCSSVRLLVSVLDKLSLTREEMAYARRMHKVPFGIMLRVVLYGYMRNKRALRVIEAECKENVNFMWLLEGYHAPDHNSIGRFINAVDIEAIFVKVVKLLEEAKEVKFNNGFVDGTKFEANAGRYTFVWKKSTEKYRAKLLPKIAVFLEEIYSRYEIRFVDTQGVINYLESRQFERTYGRGKRKPQEQRDYELAIEYRDKLNKYDDYLAIMGENRSSMSKSDPDATFMRLKDDHMRNSQLKAAYNVQLCVESEYITGYTVSADRSDAQALIPLMDKMQRDYGKLPKNLTTDAGYESEENYAYLDKHGIKAYIKPTNYEQSKTKKYKAQIGRRENMSYDVANDIYICANGKRLLPIGEEPRKNKSGYEQIVTTYRCEDCSDCPVRSACTKAQEGKNKEITYSKLFDKYRTKSLANITSEHGVKLRINRSIQSEGTFGIIKQNNNFWRLTRRGLPSVKKEIALIAIAFNINKLYSNIINDSLDFELY